MSKPSTKQKPPPYPRPVEHVSADELPLRPEDVVFHGRLNRRAGSPQPDVSDTEMEAEGRAAKRQRIQGYATAYLRGEQVFIMSAQIKGPLGKLWKNPWAKKRNLGLGTRNKPKAEVPETVQKRLGTVEVNNKRGVVLEAKKRYLALKSASQEGAPAMWSSNGVVPPTSPISTSADRSPRQELIAKVGEVKATRVKDWLRTNERFSDKSEEPLQASPTPANGSIGGPLHAQIPRSARASPSFTKSARNKFVSKEVNLPKAPQDESVMSPSVARQPQPLAQDIHHSVDDPLHPPETDVEAHTKQTSVQDLETDPKAESIPVKVKHLSSHVAPSEANFSPFEYRRATARNLAAVTRDSPQRQHLQDVRKTNEALKYPSEHLESIQQDQAITTRISDRASNEEISRPSDRPQVDAVTAEASMKSAANQQVDEQQVGDRSEEISSQGQQLGQESTDLVASGPEGERNHIARPQIPPLPSTSTTDINTVDLLPSAQRPLELIPSLSSGLQGHSLLEENTAVGADWLDTRASIYTPIELVSDQDVTPRTSVSGTRLQRPELGMTPSEPTPKVDIPLVPSSPVVPPSTQEMLAGITPLTFSTVRKRTTTTLQETPVTATKKQRKTASFAPDPHSSVSSHGSIQSAMRGRIGKKLSSPPPLFVRDSMCMDMSDEDTSKSKPKSSEAVRKSILKNASSPGSLQQSKISLFSGVEQDRQATNAIPMGNGQNNALDEEEFDLDAAISEIGSFLSPWEVDKEIESMVA